MDKKETHGRSGKIDSETSIEKVKAPNLFERAKEEVEALASTIHHPNQDKEKEKVKEKEEKKKTHKTETHGTSNDIDEETPVEKVKGPNIFERAKEEIEAIVEAIHPHKDR
ncbi:hypothetical protein LUZ60_013574 [Juncus effusus]|nr:hypothetical protein LUZ60_013574 [Juncus effusus]